MTDEDAYNLFSPNGKLSKEINEAIQNGKTVKDFLDDLKKKYSNFEKSDDNNKKSSIIQNNSEILDHSIGNNRYFLFYQTTNRSISDNSTIPSVDVVLNA